MIDTHCHLDAAEFDADRDSVYAGALAAGVSRIVVPGVEVAAFAKQKAIIDACPACLPAWGIHPLYVDRCQADDLDQLRQWLIRERPVAIGEIGLDFYVDGIDIERQTRLFAAQLKLAREFDLPVILHVRRAVDAVLRELRRVRVRGGIAHAFNGSAQQAAELIKLGFKLGYGGATTYPGSRRIRSLAATLPLDALVLETDAPDMSPAWLAGQRNSPGQLPGIAATIAALRGMRAEELTTYTNENARAILGLSRHSITD